MNHAADYLTKIAEIMSKESYLATTEYDIFINVKMLEPGVQEPDGDETSILWEYYCTDHESQTIFWFHDFNAKHIRDSAPASLSLDHFSNSRSFYMPWLSNNSI